MLVTVPEFAENLVLYVADNGHRAVKMNHHGGQQLQTDQIHLNDVCHDARSIQPDVGTIVTLFMVSSTNSCANAISLPLSRLSPHSGFALRVAVVLSLLRSGSRCYCSKHVTWSPLQA